MTQVDAIGNQKPRLPGNLATA